MRICFIYYFKSILWAIGTVLKSSDNMARFAVPHMPLQQQPHDCVRAAHAAHLFVVPERNQQCAARTEIGARSQHLTKQNGRNVYDQTCLDQKGQLLLQLSRKKWQKYILSNEFS